MRKCSIKIHYDGIACSVCTPAKHLCLIVVVSIRLVFLLKDKLPPAGNAEGSYWVVSGQVGWQGDERRVKGTGLWWNPPMRLGFSITRRVTVGSCTAAGASLQWLLKKKKTEAGQRQYLLLIAFSLSLFYSVSGYECGIPLSPAAESHLITRVTNI